jgi:hypothetical protein
LRIEKSLAAYRLRSWLCSRILRVSRLKSSCQLSVPGSRPVLRPPSSAFRLPSCALRPLSSAANGVPRMRGGRLRAVECGLPPSGDGDAKRDESRLGRAPRCGIMHLGTRTQARPTRSDVLRAPSCVTCIPRTVCATVEKVKYPASQKFFIPLGTKICATWQLRARPEFRHDSCNTAPR